MNYILILKLIFIGFLMYALYNTYTPKKVRALVKASCTKYIDKVKGWFGK